MPSSPTCMICGRATYDPDKRQRPWARGVRGGRQILICPACQEEHPGWASDLDRCAECDSPRMSITLGEIICRNCGHRESAPL